jgi:hypothetical protein
MSEQWWENANISDNRFNPAHADYIPPLYINTDWDGSSNQVGSIHQRQQQFFSKYKLDYLKSPFYIASGGHSTKPTEPGLGDTVHPLVTGLKDTIGMFYSESLQRIDLLASDQNASSTVDPSGSNVTNSFGRYIELTENFMFVSAPYEDYNDTVNNVIRKNLGAVYVYKRNSDGSIITPYSQKLVPDLTYWDGTSIGTGTWEVGYNYRPGLFGSSIVFVNDVLYIGAPWWPGWTIHPWYGFHVGKVFGFKLLSPSGDFETVSTSNIGLNGWFYEQNGDMKLPYKRCGGQGEDGHARKQVYFGQNMSYVESSQTLVISAPGAPHFYTEENNGSKFAHIGAFFVFDFSNNIVNATPLQSVSLKTLEISGISIDTYTKGYMGYRMVATDNELICSLAISGNPIEHGTRLLVYSKNNDGTYKTDTNDIQITDEILIDKDELNTGINNISNLAANNNYIALQGLNAASQYDLDNSAVDRRHYFPIIIFKKDENGTFNITNIHQNLSNPNTDYTISEKSIMFDYAGTSMKFYSANNEDYLFVTSAKDYSKLDVNGNHNGEYPSVIYIYKLDTTTTYWEPIDTISQNSSDTNKYLYNEAQLAFSSTEPGGFGGYRNTTSNKYYYIGNSNIGVYNNMIAIGNFGGSSDFINNMIDNGSTHASYGLKEYVAIFKQNI